MEQEPVRNTISPEEKLFNVIRAEKKEIRTGIKRNPTVSEPTVADNNHNLNTKTHRSEQHKRVSSFSIMKKNIFFRPKFHPYIIYSLLSGILVILIIIAGYTTMKERPDITNIIETIQKRAVRHSLISFAKIQPFKQIDFYLQETGKRNIFQPVSDETEKPIKKQKPKEDAKKKLQQIMQNLTLRGISWGDEAPKAIIKDKDGQLYFLKEGQQIGTSGAKVKKIGKEKVIIQYKDAQSEM